MWIWFLCPCNVCELSPYSSTLCVCFLYVFCKILLTYIYNLLRENPVESAPQLAEKNKALGHDDICSEH